jgi:hypothetical protein
MEGVCRQAPAVLLLCFCEFLPCFQKEQMAKRPSDGCGEKRMLAIAACFSLVVIVCQNSIKTFPFSWSRPLGYPRANDKGFDFHKILSIWLGITV